jgi:hypothetical protein
MYVAVSHNSDKIYFCNEKVFTNIDEIVSFDPRQDKDLISLYLNKKKKIYDVNQAKDKFIKTKKINQEYNDIFCVNCQIYVPLGYGCKYCSCAFCNNCYKLYEISSNIENCPICKYYN